MKKILVLLGHPYEQSFNHALARQYVSAAVEAGHEVQLLELGKLTFDPILRGGYSQRQELEPDLQAAWEKILWAEHLVLVFPTWWGVAPALLKGFFDRLFLPGMAFKYRPNSQFWDKLLSGRSAHIITTMDSPAFYNWLVYRNANIRSVRQATLEYCGIKPVRVTVFDRIRFASEKRRAGMLEKVGGMGRNGR
ncbi:MAG: NAD(P)H-dependent oxidoreductase [Saprospiraceae bacterium]|nr:NAD(P)H-dependent oxidoreductase [Saprospiraceae bacterium]